MLWGYMRDAVLCFRRLVDGHPSIKHPRQKGRTEARPYKKGQIMADISVTATAVLPATGAVILTGIAGGTIVAGQPIYEDGAAGSVLKAAQGTTLAASKVVGIALNGGAIGQRIQYIQSGNLTINAVLVAGQTYVASAAAAGGIAPLVDLTTGHFPAILGIALSTTVLKMGIVVGGVAKT